MNDWLAKWQQRLSPPPRRWLIFSIIAAVMLILAFYTVTDPHRLRENRLLDAADYAGYAVCHRITARSFLIDGRQVPLCARCTGMYLGTILTFGLLAVSGRWRRSALPPWPILLVLLGFVGLMGVDGINSYTQFFPGSPQLYQPQNWLRLVTGMGTGLAMGSILFPALAQTLWWEQEQRPAVATWRDLEGLVVAATLVTLLVLSNQPLLLYVMALMSAAGVLLILTAINSMLLLIVLQRDARMVSWQAAAVPLLAGLLLASLQIGVIALFRYQLTGTMTGFPGL
jgi:uncharacterized membrane protein